MEVVLGYKDVMENSNFQQVGVDNRETETNYNDWLPTFDEEREDREIRENMGIMSISSRRIILSANFHVPTFHQVSVSFPHVWCNRQVTFHFTFER